MIAENQKLITPRTDSGEMTCIVCPIGCRMEITRDGDELRVTGNKCKRGAAYAREEARDPRRMVTATCALSGGALARLPIRSSAAVAVDDIPGFLNAVYILRPSAPVDRGSVVGRNLAGTGIDAIATLSAPAVDPAGDERA